MKVIKSNQAAYRQFCAATPELPLFLTDWWLDAVCMDGPWDAAMVYENGAVKAVMPYYQVKGKLGHTYLTLPLWTPFMGPWLIYPEQQKYNSRLSFEKKIITQLIEQLPPFDSFIQNFSHTVSNGLPFHWQGFNLAVGYTYVLENLTDPGAVNADFKSTIRGKIRKAEKLVSVTETDEIEIFYHLLKKTYQRQQKQASVSLEFLKRINTACNAHHCRKIFLAHEPGVHPTRNHAAILLVWDSRSVYLIGSGGDPALRSSGATALLIREAVSFAASLGKQFDFEGSMIQPIEEFFSSFGAAQKSYLSVSKVNSTFLKFKQLLHK